nr:MAG TPA: hypothetical protein [Caudoviricetes sp.]
MNTLVSFLSRECSFAHKLQNFFAQNTKNTLL